MHYPTVISRYAFDITSLQFLQKVKVKVKVKVHIHLI